MPEVVVNPEAPAEPTTEVTPETPAKDETDWKAEARKWEGRAKENSSAAAKLAEIEESNKTEAQKLSERAEIAEKALAAKELEADRALVALEKGLTASQAKRLVGASRDEFLADADQLLADLGKPANAPREDLSQGPKAVSKSQTPADAFADHLKTQLGR